MKSVKSLAVAAVLVLGFGGAVLAGAYGGPRFGVYDVQAFSTNTHTIMFRGGELARIVIDGDGDTDLDVYVRDEFGNLMDSDTDYTDYCIVSWVPRRTGTFTITVVNRGSVYNRYTISTN